MEKEYLLTKCVHPRRVFNPYTKQFMEVPCGHCKACLMKKSYTSYVQCELERKSSAYCLFLTLTYDNDNLPLARSVVNYLGDTYLQDLSTGNLLCEVTMDSAIFSKLLKKFKLSGYVPYLRKSDVQKYLKRIRKHINKYYHEKIRFYAVGEYGPVHYRPHYHLLLFFNSRRLSEDIRQIVSEKWQFGIVDSSFVVDGAVSYVTKYVNSNYVIPSIFKSRSIKPFSCHSTRLGESFFSSSYKEVYEMSTEDFINRSVVISSSLKTVRLWRNFTVRYFPKCKGFFDKSFSELYLSYTLYQTVKRESGRSSLKSMSRFLLKSIISYKRGKKFSPMFTEVLEYFIKSYGHIYLDLVCNKREFLYKSSYTKPIYDAFIKELSCSRHFIEDICMSNFNLYYTRLSRIVSFYKELDYIILRDSLVKLESNTDVNLLDYYYIGSESIDGLKSTFYYNDYVSTITTRFNNSIKHKKLNDLNNIFNNN